MSRRLRSRFGPLAVITWLYILWSLVPVLIAIRISFNSGRSRSAFQSLSLRWYYDDPTSVWKNDELRHAMLNSLRLAGLCMLLAVPLGVMLAIGLQRWRGRTSRAANTLMLVPLVTPEIVIGVALFLVFTQLYTGVPRGFTTMLLGHVTFSVSYVVVIVRARLISIGFQFEEAARDLGATRLQALRMVLLPQLGPAIFAALMVTFATSIDDFVISSFLSTGVGTETVPIKIYSTGRASSTPNVNALATVMLTVTMLAIASTAVVLRRWRRHGNDDAHIVGVSV
ncbi:MAG: ABC transporter permease [Actinomycetota bacterium]|nr:ABC transporter permease [Actinomycetota bacterium]MDA2973919.1 ABC transporter permease [Actinomycetota bacterium]MDA3009791.1 ABC transporter permease [Actinomycetota bacterium]